MFFSFYFIYYVNTQIYDMESELERVRLQSSQTQRSLTGRIQQLQTALNLCLGGAGDSALLTNYSVIPQGSSGFPTSQNPNRNGYNGF